MNHVQKQSNIQLIRLRKEVSSKLTSVQLLLSITNHKILNKGQTVEHLIEAYLQNLNVEDND